MIVFSPSFLLPVYQPLGAKLVGRYVSRFVRRISTDKRAFSQLLDFLTRCRLLVAYLDRDMEFVWTPKHLDKMSWHRSSSVPIRPLQPTKSFFSANPATIRIDSFRFPIRQTIKKGDRFRIAVIREASVMGDFMSPKRFSNIGSAPS